MSVENRDNEFSFATLGEEMAALSKDSIVPIHNFDERGSNVNEGLFILDSTDAIPDADGNHSGLHHLDLLEMEARAKEQKRLHDLYSTLLEVTSEFLEPLVPKKEGVGSEIREGGLLVNPEQFCTWVNEYLKKIAPVLRANKVAHESNFVKLIDGIVGELSTVVNLGYARTTLDLDMVREKVANLARVLSNVSAALLTHRNEGVEWNEFEKGIPDLLGVVAPDIYDVSAIELEMAMGATHDEIMSTLPGLNEKIANPGQAKQAKLDAYASGDLSIAGITYEKIRWAETQAALRKLKRNGPKKL